MNLAIVTSCKNRSPASRPNRLLPRKSPNSWREMRISTFPEALRVLAKDEDPAVRATAGMALAQICGGRFVPRSHRTAPPEVVKEAMPLLLGMLDHNEVHDVAPLTFALGSLAPEHPEIVPALLKIIKQSSDSNRRDVMVSAIGSSAGQIRKAEDVALIVQTFSDLVENDSANVVRMRAAAYLGVIGARAESALPV